MKPNENKRERETETEKRNEKKVSRSPVIVTEFVYSNHELKEMLAIKKIDEQS